MKRMIFAVVLIAMSCGAMASPADDVKGYFDSLKSVAVKCSDMGYSIGLQDKLASQSYEQKLHDYGADAAGDPPGADTAAVIANVNKVNSCKENAEYEGADIYKAFIAGNKNKQLQADAKDVFVAWLAYVKTIHISEGFEDTPERAVLNESQSRMHADALL